jgi:hypothetical protein
VTFEVGQWVYVEKGRWARNKQIKPVVGCIRAISPCQPAGFPPAFHLDLGDGEVACTQFYHVRLATVREVLTVKGVT